MDDPNAPVQMGGISATLDITKPIETAPQETEIQKSFISNAPEQYRDKHYFANMLKAENPYEEMFKQYESAQSMLGQRTGLQVPGESATAEQVKEFHKALGVPETADEYKLPEIQWEEVDKPYGELIAKNRVPGVFEALGAKAHELGIRPDQYKALAETYDKAMVKGVQTSMKEAVDQQIAKDKDFDSRLRAQYGDKAPQVFEHGKKLLEANLSQDELNDLVDLPPVALAKLTAALYKIGTKYIREDRFNSTSGVTPQSTTFSNAAEVTKAANTIRMQPEFYDKNKNHAKHKELVAQVDKLYKDNEHLFT